MKENFQPPKEPEEIAEQHLQLIESKTQLAQQEQLIENLSLKLKASEFHLAQSIKRKDDLELKIRDLNSEYQQLLENSIQEEEQNNTVDVSNIIQDIKNKIESQYAAKMNLEKKGTEDLKDQLARKEAELAAVHQYVFNSILDTFLIRFAKCM
jgi:kinesin family member 5